MNLLFYKLFILMKRDPLIIRCKQSDDEGIFDCSCLYMPMPSWNFQAQINGRVLLKKTGIEKMFLKILDQF